MRARHKNIITVLLLLFTISAEAQNPTIKCYFNKSVDNALSTGTNAINLNSAFPDTIAAYINRAKYTLDIAVYNFSSTGTDILAKIATSVNDAYTRGVVVRWIYDGSSGNSGLSLLNTNIPTIGSPTSGSYGIMHNKFVVIDVNSANSEDPYVISGSYNFTLSQTNTDYNNIIIIQNKDVALAYYNEFNKMWGGTDNTPNLTSSKFGTRKTTSAAHYFNVNGTDVQVHFSPKDTCSKYLSQVINSSDYDLFFGIYAFTNNTIANLILNKFNTGVAVRGIMDNFSKIYSPYTTLSTPLANNMISYTGTGLYHNKIMLVDALAPSSDPQVLTGSYNWSASAESSNDENFIIVHDQYIANQYYQSMCKNITDMGGNACITTLPLEWTSFNASISNNNTGTLNWATGHEQNNDHFEVEHAFDGIHFSRIGIVSAMNSVNGNRYQYIDSRLHEGYNYYRIKSVDKDGNFQYSKLANIYNRPSDKFIIYPNPVTSSLQVLLQPNNTKVFIYNITGLLIKEIDTKNISTVNINLSGLSKGAYFVKLITDKGVFQQQFIKE